MKPRTYDTPAAFKRALEDRLKAASTSGVDFARRRQLLVFDRFLARIAVAFGEAVMLKARQALSPGSDVAENLVALCACQRLPPPARHSRRVHPRVGPRARPARVGGGRQRVEGRLLRGGGGGRARGVRGGPVRLTLSCSAEP